VRELARDDLNAIFFVSAYFIKACELLENQRLSPTEITARIKAKMQILMNMTSIETYRERKFGADIARENYSSPSYFWEAQEQVQRMTFKKLLLRKEIDKNAQIENFIMDMVGQGRKHYSKFRRLVEYASHLNGGTNYHIGFKIQQRSETKSMKRIKEKLLKQHFNKCLNEFFSVKRAKQEHRFDEMINALSSYMT
jgi:hypothetical protein